MEKLRGQYLTSRKKRAKEISIAATSEPPSKIPKLVGNSSLQANFCFENLATINDSEHFHDFSPLPVRWTSPQSGKLERI